MQHSNPDAMDEAMSRTRADERYRHIHPRGYGHDMSAAAGNGPPRFVLM
jgi:hypothetical protein